MVRGRSLASVSTQPDSFGPLEFQLVLLRRMADFQPELVTEALRQLEVDRSSMREANRRWQARVRAPHGRGALRRYRAVLGAPQTVEDRTFGDLRCQALSWPVPLWPTLRFEILTAPGGGPVWNEWLVRAPEAQAPPLHTVADLLPWSCTVDEVARAFAPVEPLEGSAPSRWRLRFTAPGSAEPDVQPRLITAEFTWGLLQRLPEH